MTFRAGSCATAPDRGVLCFSRRNHSRFSHEDRVRRLQLEKEKFPFLVPDPGDTLAELVSGVKLLDLGWRVGVW